MNSASDPQINIPPNDDREIVMMQPSSGTTSQAIAAVPVSYKRPDDDVVVTSTSRKKRRTSEPPEGWICVPQTRKNGVVDKFYFHKELNIRCRSLKEIARFCLYGIGPGPRGKEKEQEILAAAMKKLEAREKVGISSSTVTCEQDVAEKNIGKSENPTGSKRSEHQILVEKLLAEAWDNMMQPSDKKAGSWEEIPSHLPEEMEMILKEERRKMERKLEEEREAMNRKFQELERKFEELQQWMKHEIQQRIQTQLDATIPTILLSQGTIPPKSGGSCKE